MSVLFRESGGPLPWVRYLCQKYDLNPESWQQKYAEGQVLLMDKPLQWTSFDVVKKIRIQTRISRTLDRILADLQRDHVLHVKGASRRRPR